MTIGKSVNHGGKGLLAATSCQEFSGVRGLMRACTCLPPPTNRLAYLYQPNRDAYRSCVSLHRGEVCSDGRRATHAKHCLTGYGRDNSPVQQL